LGYVPFYVHPYFELFDYNKTIKLKGESETMRNYSNPIPKLVENTGWESVGINECFESLVSLKSIDCGRITIRPEYFSRGISSAMDDCFVREKVAERLICASELLPDGMCLVILDGWRPIEVQESLFDVHYAETRKCFPGVYHEELVDITRRFISKPSLDPLKPSPHLTGGSVDLAVMDDKGRLLKTGTDFDHFGKESYTDHYERKSSLCTLSDSEKEFMNNRRLLYNVMKSAGFSNYSCEWWHFDYGNQFWGKIMCCDAIYGMASVIGG
jgi:zinc D-Ala-D-Ala dipeptidase